MQLTESAKNWPEFKEIAKDCIVEICLKTNYTIILLQCALDLRKILGVAKKFLKSRSFLFQTQQNP